MSAACNTTRGSIWLVGRLSSVLLLLSGVVGCALSPASTPIDVPSVVSVAAVAPSSDIPVVSSPTTAPVIPAQAQQLLDAAIAQLKNGQSAPAKQQFQQLMLAYPAFATPVINLGLMELKAGRFTEAAELFKQALQRDKNSAVANNYLGVCYRNLGKFNEAEAAYRAAIAVDDSYAAAHLNLGVLYDLYLQHPELALPEFERYQALQTTPDTKVAGWIKEVKGRLGSKNKPAAGA